MKIGYISRVDVNLNPNSKPFKLYEATCTRKINTRGDKIYSKMLCFPVDYEEVENNTEHIRSHSLIVVNEPFFIDDKLRGYVQKWIDWANETPQSEYSLFGEEKENDKSNA